LVPYPYLDLTAMIPPKVFTIFSEITNPKPIPYVFIYLVFCSVPNNLNNFTLSLLLIPIPESITEIINLSLPVVGLNISDTL